MSKARCGMCGVWLYRISLFWLFSLVWGVGTLWADVNQRVAIVVSSLDQGDSAGAAWLQGAWKAHLRERFVASEQFLGGTQQDTQLERAKKAYQEGKKAYEDLNPDLSFRQFKEAMQFYEGAATYVHDIKPLAQTLLYLGISHFLNGRRKESDACFLQALLYREGITLAGITTESDKLQLLSKAQEALGGLSKVSVKIDATPRASVFLDGEYRGVTPLTLLVYPGRHLLSLRREGYRWWGKTIEIKGESKHAPTLEALEKKGAWEKESQAAVDAGITEQGEAPAAVKAALKTTQSGYLVLAQVKEMKGRLWVRASAYQGGRQIATGGAWLDQSKDLASAQELLRSLLAGNTVRLRGWLPGEIGQGGSPKAGGGGNTGLWIGLGIAGGALLVGGAVALTVVLLSQPRCERGACVSLVLK